MKSRRALRERRREVERHVAEIAPPKGSRLPAGRSAKARTLRPAFELEGPLFAAAGLCFASRPDLLPEEACHELAAIADRAPAMDSAAARELLSRELGAPLGDRFSYVELEPFASRLLSQSHRGWLRAGGPVTLELIRPEVTERMTQDLEALDVLEPILAGHVPERARSHLGEALAEVRELLERRCRPELEAAGLADSAREAKASGRIVVPRVYRDLTTPRLLVTSALPGPTLAGLLEEGHDLAELGGGGELAYQLASLWLRQVLTGRRFPLVPGPENVVVLADRRLALSGPLARSTSEDRERLSQYLTAVAGQDPDAAYDALRSQLKPEGENEELRRQLRQLVPMREAPGLGTNESMVVHLLLHARLIRKLGVEPGPVLLSFYRGLFWIHDTARKWAPDVDVVGEALATHQLGNELAELRERMDPARLGENLRRYAVLWMELPHKLDALLSRVAGYGPVDQERSLDGERASTGTSDAAALVLALVAFALLFEHLDRAVGVGPWNDRVAAVVFLVLGALVLKKVGSRHG